MKDRYIAPAVMLIAGVVMSVVNLLNHEELLTSLERLLAVLVCFYIIGKIAAAVIRKFTVVKAVEETPENNMSEQDEEAKENTETE